MHIFPTWTMTQVSMTQIATITPTTANGGFWRQGGVEKVLRRRVSIALRGDPSTRGPPWMQLWCMRISWLSKRLKADSRYSVLFVVTLASTIWWVYQEHRPTGTAAPTTQPQAHDGLGGGAGVPIVAPQEPTATYSQPQMQQQQQQYYQGQPQPSPAGYNQSIPQAQYSQPTTGYPSPQMQPANPTYSTGVPVSGH